MSLITREEKGSKLTIQEMDGNLTYLSQNMELESGGISYSINLSSEGIKLVADGGGGEVLGVGISLEWGPWEVPPVPGTYEVSPTTSGSGTGLLVNVTVENGVEYPIITAIEVINGGSEYLAGDTLEFNTKQLGADDPVGQDFEYVLGSKDVSAINRQSIEIANVGGGLYILMPNLNTVGIEDGSLYNDLGRITITTPENDGPGGLK